MENDFGELPVLSGEQAFTQLLLILDYLDREGQSLAALHVCEALEALSPGDPRIPLVV